MSRASSSHPPRLGQAGATTLEFALVASAFLGLIFGVMDLARYYVVEQSLRTVTSEVTRVALVNTGLSTGTNADGTPQAQTANTLSSDYSSALQLVPLLDMTNLQLAISQNPSSLGPITVKVTATYTFTSLAPFWSSLDGQLTEVSQLSY